MPTRRTACAALLVAATATATATACGSSGEPETIRVTVTQTVTAAPGEATAKQSGPLKMGAKTAIVEAENDLHLTVQAVKYEQPYKGPQPQAPQDFQGGDVWASAEVKVCNVQGGDISVSQFPWSLAYEDGTSVEVTGSSGGDMPKPEFPMDKTIKPGRCAAGFIAYPVPSDKRPERLVYEPDGAEPTEWVIPKA